MITVSFPGFTLSVSADKLFWPGTNPLYDSVWPAVVRLPELMKRECPASVCRLNWRFVVQMDHAQGALAETLLRNMSEVSDTFWGIVDGQAQFSIETIVPDDIPALEAKLKECLHA